MALYATVEDTTAYAEGSLEGYAAWTAASAALRLRAVTTASRHIEAIPMLVLETPVQETIETVCMEEAVFLITMLAEDWRRLRKTSIGVQNESLEEVSESVFPTAGRGHDLLSPVARQMIKPYIQRWGVIV